MAVDPFVVAVTTLDRDIDPVYPRVKSFNLSDVIRGSELGDEIVIWECGRGDATSHHTSKSSTQQVVMFDSNISIKKSDYKPN